MPANRKHLAAWAPEDRWQLLGELLAEWRRVRLGLGTMVALARDRLPLTPEGNPNRRRVDDLENNRRPNRWPKPTLEEMAAAYGVTYASMRDVLDGKADQLEAAATAPAAAPPSAPPSDLLREDADRGYFTSIWDRILDLADHGISDPTGAQLGLAEADAKLWDGTRGAMSRGDRAWLLADIQRRRREARDTANGRPGASTA